MGQIRVSDETKKMLEREKKFFAEKFGLSDPSFDEVLQLRRNVFGIDIKKKERDEEEELDRLRDKAMGCDRDSWNLVVGEIIGLYYDIYVLREFFSECFDDGIGGDDVGSE